MTHLSPLRAAQLAVFWLIVCGSLSISSGCAPMLSNVMASAPNRFHPLGSQNLMSAPERNLLGVDEQFRVTVGPPEADLAVSLMEPEGEAEPRGTILVLHGIWNKSFWMLGTARMLAEEGYRAVLVDLRGHGASTGKWLTYGQREAQDLSQVIDALEDKGLIAGRLGVYGISYGATTSIHLAGVDPRIECVVAVAPFSRMRDEVPDYSRTVLPGIQHVMTEEEIQQAVDDAGKRGDFDPELSDAVSAIARTSAPVLLMHGTKDWLVPPYHSLRLYEAGRDHSELVFLPKIGHISIWFDPQDEVASKTKQWFERWLAESPSQSSPGRFAFEESTH